MALGIYTNNYSVIAQNNLTSASNSMTKSIQRLSSGLRINNASDDASGLAISEKLRAQIRGLNRANMNAQDAVSFLQTAEGGMEVIGDMVQRMRELAVQAGNGTYTTNDRKALQQEVDQLKEEINRISASTEYNTKKLLTGDAAGLWSSSSDGIEAIIRGAPAEGNYKLSISTDPGANAVYKSDIMDLKEQRVNVELEGNNVIQGAQYGKGALTGTYTLDIANTDGAPVTNNGATLAGAAQAVTQLAGGTGDAAMGAMKVVNQANISGNGTLVIEVSGGINANAGVIDTSGAVTYTYTYTDNITGEQIKGNVAVTQAAASAAGTLTVDLSALGTLSISASATDANKTMDIGDSWRIALVAEGTAPTVTNNSGTLGTPTAITVGTTAGSQIINSATGSYNGAVTITGNEAANQTGYLVVQKISDIKGITAGMTVNVQFVDAATGNITDLGKQNISAGSLSAGSTGDSIELKDFMGSGSSVKINFAVGAANNTIEKGTTWAVTLQGQQYSGTGVDGRTLVKADQSTAEKANYTATLTTSIAYDTSDEKGKSYGVAMNSDGTFNVFGFEAEWNAEDMAVLVQEKAQIASMNTTKVANLDTTLQEIKRFTNADGRMMLDNAQELTVYGNGTQASFFIEGCDTIQDFDDKLTKALVDMGMGATAETAGSQEEADKINAALVNYVTNDNVTTAGNTAVEGTFVIQSALLGANSQISFSGDEGIVNAFSLATIQDYGKSQTTVTVTDAHTGEVVGEDTVCDNTLRGVIAGVDVKVDSNLGTSMSVDTATGTISFARAQEDSEVFLHVVNNGTEVQIGANEGQTFDVSIGRMDTTSLEIDDAVVTTMELSQKAITKFDQALEKITSSRGMIGAQINRLEYTQRNLTISAQNLTAAESRIRDLDVATESAAFAKNNILVNAAVAMLAQANQLPQVALQLIGR